MIFEYSATRTFNEMIDIVDIGNMALRCIKEKDACEYFIITKTVFGKTSIIKFGPICPDIDMLIDGFEVEYKKMDYKESKIEKEIDKFINDFKKEVSLVEEITEYEAWQNFPEIQQLFKLS